MVGTADQRSRSDVLEAQFPADLPELGKLVGSIEAVNSQVLGPGLSKTPVDGKRN